MPEQTVPRSPQATPPAVVQSAMLSVVQPEGVQHGRMQESGTVLQKLPKPTTPPPDEVQAEGSSTVQVVPRQQTVG